MHKYAAKVCLKFFENLATGCCTLNSKELFWIITKFSQNLYLKLLQSHYKGNSFCEIYVHNCIYMFEKIK